MYPMKFIGLRIFITILEVIAFVLIAPCLVAIGWALFSGDHPLWTFAEKLPSLLRWSAWCCSWALSSRRSRANSICACSLSGIRLMLPRTRRESGKQKARPRHQPSAVVHASRVGSERCATRRICMVVILVYAFSAATSRDAQVKEVSRDEPVANQNCDSYSPERIAGYCRTHPTSLRLCGKCFRH